MAEPTIVLGFESKFTIGGTVYNVRSGSLTIETTTHEVGGTVDGAWDRTKDGKKRASFEAELQEDSTVNYYNTGGLTEGAYKTVLIEPRGAGQGSYSAEYCLERVTWTHSVENPNTLRISGKSNGALTVTTI